MAQAFAQTGRLFRFSLKKDWLKIFLWLLGAAFFVFVGVFAFVEVYGDPAEREAMAFAMQNPAMEALFGRAVGENNYTIGAMYTHMMTIMTFVLLAIMSILLVVRNTRSEEEDGILELIQAQPTGRVAHTTAAILLLVTTNILVLIISAGVLLAFGDSSMALEGALLTGTIYAGIGIFFGAVTLVTAQLSSNARGAMMLAFGVLGLSYVIRIIGDGSMPFLSWFSPLGLLYNTEPFVNNYWYPVFISLGISLLLIALALYLKQKRDMGSGLLPDRDGKRHASAFLKTPAGFVLDLIKTPLIVWTASMALLGISYGSVIGDVDSLLEGNDVVSQIIAGQEGISMSEQFMAMILGVLGIISSIPAVQFLYRIHGEEKKGRLDKLIAGTHSRYVILGTFFILSALIAVFMQLVTSLTFGGAAVVMDFDVDFVDVLLAGMGYVPAIFVMIGLGTLLLGWLPKLTSLAWLYLGFVFVNLYFGELFDFPEWLSNLSAFHYVPEIPIEDWSWTVFLSLTGAAIILSVIGFIGFRRRDIN
ncbi:ABC-2 type transport system permease protein [Alkalibacterium putridalgicola]|uniref:ABC transporter permease n=1 Tax=Alkalibacterium putridalgicola TaxID=426703 RepID=A0A1H7THA4_9LACT|nr:ABC transporter permease subunit [Alkalibacterium putridalgicola]GEK89471.1 ABC transporter permease [Alkalibacterium putridalgicola]SEL84058.1 ABC-2 type transport system permease protein [Alkalibacterium putridalgicola]